MKFLDVLLAPCLLAASVLAAPQGSGSEPTLYSLLVTSTEENINGRFVVSDAGSIVLTDDRRAPLQVYVTDSTLEGASELHTWPIGIVDHVIALSGGPALQQLVDELSITLSSPSLSSFIVNGALVVDDSAGEWRAFPTAHGWTIHWYDGVSPITANAFGVQITLVEVTTEE
jgi:hypothetical protein